MPIDSLALAPPPSAQRQATATHRQAPVGAGWFESSWDLRHGLEVTEEGRVDAALRTWIDGLLVAPPAQPRAARVASPRAMTAIA